MHEVYLQYGVYYLALRVHGKLLDGSDVSVKSDSVAVAYLPTPLTSIAHNLPLCVTNSNPPDMGEMVSQGYAFSIDFLLMKRPPPAPSCQPAYDLSMNHWLAHSAETDFVLEEVKEALC
jgi:hypothetical protein